MKKILFLLLGVCLFSETFLGAKEVLQKFQDQVVIVTGASKEIAKFFRDIRIKGTYQF